MGQEFSSSAVETDNFDNMKKYAGFSPKQVEMIKERFELMCDENSSVDKGTFAKLLKITSMEADTVFGLFDMDKSGTVDSYEFVCGLALLSQSTLDEKAELIFDLYDFDKSQLISIDELQVLMKTTLTSLAAMNQAKAPTQKEVDAKAKEILKRWDTNKDGSMSRDEFKSFVSKDPDVLRLLMNYGLVNREELRPDFGGANEDVPDCDSDLEEELRHADIDPRSERITLGIEYSAKDKNPDDMYDVEEIAEGDQFMAVKPWIGTVKNSVPTSYQPRKGESDAPEASLDLEYVHGYRCHDARNNLKYAPNGHAVYHTAAVGVVLDTKANVQKFCIEHTDDITCLDTFGDLVVTGQVGAKPEVIVWNSATRETKAIFKGDLQKSIAQVCFSNDGKLVAAVANDDDHTIGIFNLEKFLDPKYDRRKAKTDGTMVFGKGPKAGVLDAKFDSTNKTLILACVKEVNFVTFEGGVVKCTKATGIKQPQAILCIGFIDQTAVTGTFSGALFVWKGKSLTNTIPAHTGACNAIWTRKTQKGIITGGNDGLVIVWDAAFKKLQTFDIKAADIKSMNPKVRSICENGKNILVGTRGGEIIEYTDTKAKVVMRGHFDEELWGLCVHPNKDKKEYITVGEDQLLAAWDISTRKQKKSVKIDYPAKVLAYSPDEKFLAVGCKNGFVLILNPETFSTNNTIKDRSKEISVLKFSPNSELLAVGAHDSEIFLYSVKKGFKVQSKLRGHHSTITHFDFAIDSNVLQSTCTSYELLYFDTKSGKRNPSGASANRDEPWATWTCILGWPVQGIWPECSDGSDINSLDRHPTNNIIATGDDFSKVKLFKYPCPVERSSFVKVVGHSSHVTCVRFTAGGDYLISTGGHDKSIFQWKYHFDAEGDHQSSRIHESAVEEDEEEEKAQEDNMFEEEVIEGGDEALAVKPFKGQVDKSWPTGFTVPKDAAKAPNGNLSLKYCHGFRCFDAKNAVKYCSNPEKVVFVAAALGVVMDIKTKEQGFFQMHEEDVICLAVSPNGKYAASGQMAQKGKAKRIDMFVWDIESKTMVSRMNNFHLRAVCLVEFSPDGTKLLSIGRDDDNSLAIYDWAQGLLLVTAKVDKNKVTGLACKSDSEFMTCGLKHVKFYTLNGKNVKALRGSLDTSQQNEAFLCATYFGNTAVCGTQSGNLVPFNGTAAGKSVAAHKGGVWTLRAQKNSLYSGGADGRILVWTAGFAKAVEVTSLAKVTKFLPGIVSLDVRPEGNSFLVGTRGSEIYEIKKDGKADLLLQGHYDGELWGCAVSPDSMKYVTCGGDNTIRLWDAQKFWMLASTKPLENDVRGVYWAPNGKFIVAADVKGKIILLDPKDLTIKDNLQSSFTKQNQWIEDIKVSPDSTRIAFGAHGGTSPIEIMAVNNDSKLAKKSSINVGLSSALLHVDWSTDNNFLVVNSQAYELKFISVSAGKDVSASSSKDTDWFTWTCKLGFPVIGIFQSVDYTDVNTVCRAGNRKILATGDDNGKVNLFKYPCVVEKAQCKGYIGHSSHVTRVKFTYDDSRVISTGGNDKCVLVWDTDFGSGGGAATKAPPKVEKEPQHDASTDQDYEDEEAQHVQKKGKKDKYERTKKEVPDESEGVEAAGGDFFQVEKIEGGDEFLAVKPWLGAIKEPTGWKKAPLNQNQAPKVDLELEYVHGYRAKDCRNNLKYLKDGNIVYHAAALGIVMEVATNTQKFFKEHTDDITAMDLHPNGIFVATGQLGPKPEIFVWDTNSLQIIWKFKGMGLEKGIAALSFSPSGNKLAGTAIDDNHYVAVYDIELGALVCSEKGDTAKIVDLKFKSENEFASVGPKHFKLWTFQNKQMTSKKGSFGSASDLLRCVSYNENNFIVGDAKGCLQVWNGNSMIKAHAIHGGGVDSIWAGPSYVVTGGADENIMILDKKTYASLLKIPFNSVVKQTSICPKIRSACFSADNKSLLVGTYGSEIYEISVSDPKITAASKFGNPKELVKGHYTPNQKWTNEIWGLGVFSDDDRWCTCSDDATLRIWSSSKRKMLKHVKLDTDKDGKTLAADPKTGDLDDSAKGRSIDVSPDDRLVAVGCKDGTLRVYEVDGNSAMKQIYVSKLAKEWIQELKFSPDGQTLAVGSHDNSIYLLTVPDFKRKFAMRKHSSFITHLDWSVDGNNLHSNCGAYELLFWDANTGKQVTSGATAFRDEKWATWTCVLGWPVQGIWPPFTSGDDINYVSRSASKTPGGYELLAMADDFGKVKILRYPSLQKGSEGVVGVGHSSHVTCVKWSPKDEVLYSTGGEDNCVFQWRVSSQVK